MKKILVLLMALLVSTSVFAQKKGKRVTASHLRARLDWLQEQALEQRLIQDDKVQMQEKLNEELEEELEETIEIDENALGTMESFVAFTNEIKTKTSQDVAAIFQALEPVEANFMALAAENPDEAAHLATVLNHPIVLADGKNLLLANYLRAEMAKLPAEQQMRLKDFRETFLKSLE